MKNIIYIASVCLSIYLVAVPICIFGSYRLKISRPILIGFSYPLLTIIAAWVLIGTCMGMWLLIAAIIEAIFPGITIHP